jgi:hypothetical protein
MALSNLSIEYSERVYTALLSLYPFRFRIRFAPELLQLFRDCCHDALEKGQFAVVVAFWLKVTRDLIVSALRERGREWLGPMSDEHPLTAIVDLLLIPSMVTIKLVALGPILALLFAGGATVPADQFAFTSAFFSFAIGILAIAASLLVTKLRPNVRLWVKLSA